MKANFCLLFNYMFKLCVVFICKVFLGAWKGPLKLMDY